MPMIEEVPITSTKVRTTHGWAYVPDTTFDASRAAVGSSAPRKKRLAREAHRPAGADTSARQAKAVAARLAELDKENYKDAAPIPVPATSVTKTKGKATANVRRILTSGRNFGHWLAAEEADLSLQQSNPTSSRSAAAAAAAATASTSMPPPPHPKTQQTTSTPASAAFPAVTSPKTASSTDPLDHLSRTALPPLPTQRVLGALLAEPPLTYNNARAGPSSLGLPTRHFCSVCGYWGKIRCRKCGDRTCGRMECFRGHEEGCAVGW